LSGFGGYWKGLEIFGVAILGFWATIWATIWATTRLQNYEKSFSGPYEDSLHALEN
jgi:hypothetical protein